MSSLKIQIGEMQYKCPALVHLLYDKCHVSELPIEPQYAVMLKARGLMSPDGTVPPHVKDFVFKNLSKDAGGRISITL